MGKTSAKMPSKALRPCVLGVFRNASHQILVCERSDQQGGWQLPQGGVETDESPEQAIHREMEEELGVRDFAIVATALEPVSYNFPSDLDRPITKKYSGQKQTWFLLEFKSGCIPNLDAAETREFINWKWVSANEVLALAIDWKKESYLQGLAKFYLI